jgi:hypothetical protein
VNKLYALVELEDYRITGALSRWVERRAELGKPVPEEVVAGLTRMGLYVPPKPRSAP